MKLRDLGIYAALALALAACARSKEEPLPQATACACDSAGPIVDSTLLAFLSKAKALHEQADIAEDAKDRGAAIKSLERIFDTPVPGGGTPAPEAEEVLADARARVADLRASQGDFDKAVADVNDGLLHAKAPTYFRGHLYEVLGSVEERRAASLTKSNAAASQVDAARKRAIDASEAAVRIQDEVIKRAMEKRK